MKTFDACASFVLRTDIIVQEAATSNMIAINESMDIIINSNSFYV